MEEVLNIDNQGTQAKVTRNKVLGALTIEWRRSLFFFPE